MSSPMNGRPVAPLSAAERRAARFWPALILTLIGAQIAMSAVTLYYATSSGRPVIEPDYYRKAIDWNQHAAQLARNRELGWTAKISVDGPPQADATRALQVDLRTADGTPLEAARVQATLFHHAGSADRSELELPAGLVAGMYVVRAPMPRDGLYECRLTVTRAGETFTHTETFNVGAPAGMFKWGR